jgi:hypothetical protein
VVVREGVPCVSFSWGLDEDMIERTHRAGASALVQVGSDAEATRAVAAGADVIIAQGTEAGGHVQSTVPLHRLLSRPPRGSWAADRRGGRDRRVRGRPRRPDCRCRRRRVWDGPSRGPRGGCPPALPGAPHRCRARGSAPDGAVRRWMAKRPAPSPPK